MPPRWTTRKFDHALLVGPPGMGKSVPWPQSLPRRWRPTSTRFSGQSIKNVADLNALLLAAKDKDVVHIDECHELGKEYQTALYLAVDKRKLDYPGRQDTDDVAAGRLHPVAQHDGRIWPAATMPGPHEAACFGLSSIRKPNSSRCCGIAARHCDGPWTRRSSPKSPKRAKGTPRLALRLLQSARRCARAEGDNAITLDHLQPGLSFGAD